jgi:hypothetical protein
VAFILPAVMLVAGFFYWLAGGGLT